MNSYRKVAQSLFLAAGLGALAAGPAIAGPGCEQMGAHHEHHAKMLEQHHQQLHQALKLTPAQEPLWSQLIESERPGPAFGGGAAEDWARLSAPERAEKMLERSQARQAQMAEHVAALKAFYAALTPEQQKAFEDAHAAPRHGMHARPAAKALPADKAPAKR